LPPRLGRRQALVTRDCWTILAVRCLIYGRACYRCDTSPGYLSTTGKNT
jgi:hypothetical protein